MNSVLYGLGVMFVVGTLLTIGELIVRQILKNKRQRKAFLPAPSFFDERDSLQMFKRMNS